MIAIDPIRETGDLSRLFGGEIRLFRLPLGRLRHLEKACGRTGELAGRLLTGTWGVEDIRQPILHGLIGGGLSEPEASRLVLAFVDRQPLAAHVGLAAEILAALINGAEDAAAEAAAEAGENPPPGASAAPATSPPSTPPAS